MKMFSILMAVSAAMHYLACSFVSGAFNPALMNVDNKIGTCIFYILFTMFIAVFCTTRHEDRKF